MNSSSVYAVKKKQNLLLYSGSFLQLAIMRMKINFANLFCFLTICEWEVFMVINNPI